MIQNINIENYKAFETAKIPLRPITILLGANSVGKSSIIQLMLMLQQTGKTGLKSYKSPLKLYGGYVNLGDKQIVVENMCNCDKTNGWVPIQLQCLNKLN